MVKKNELRGFAPIGMLENRLPRRLTVSGEFDDQMIRIRFQDTGPGISEENIQKIFEPFFTTKGKGKGACFVVELPIMRTSSPA